MAEEQYVRMEQFSEFMRRMDDRFDHVNQRFDHVNELADQRYDNMNQRFLDLEKRTEQGFVHVEQRFEQVDKRLDDVQAEVRSLRTMMLTLYVPIVIAVAGAIVASAVKYLFFS